MLVPFRPVGPVLAKGGISRVVIVLMQLAFNAARFRARERKETRQKGARLLDFPFQGARVGQDGELFSHDVSPFF